MPGSNPQKDLDAFKRIFTDSAFKPDMIKIYPCLCIAGTKAYEWHQQGTYEPYTTEEATALIAEIKKTIPPWVRVMRVQRDIPARLILAGVKRSNVRQLGQEKLKAQGGKCQCIRCREVGHRLAVDGVKPDIGQSHNSIVSLMMLQRAKKSSFQPKTKKTTFCLVTCAYVFPRRRLTDQKSLLCHQLLFVNFTFTVHLCRLESILRARGSIKVLAQTC